MIRRLVSGIVLLAVFTTAWPCGPFITTWQLVAVGRPDGDPADWAAGRLGLIQPYFPTRDLGIIWRWLSGVGLDDAEQKALLEAPGARDGEKEWQEARALAGAAPKALVLGRSQNYAFESVIGAHALYLAAHTLRARLRTFGPASPAVQSWIRAQDRVFAFEGPEATLLPEPAEATLPALIKQDRVYQCAAARFYRGQIAEALKGFGTVAEDASSPWRGWGLFMKARIYARCGLIADSDLDANSALEALDQIQRDPALRALRRDASALENRIRFQEDGRAFYPTLLEHLAQKGRGPAIVQDLEDLRWLRRLEPWKGQTPWPGFSPTGLHAWIERLQKGSLEELVQAYDADPSLPNLVAVMMILPAEHPRVETFLKIAQQASRRPGPAYATLVTHRLRILMARGQGSAVKTLADEALARLEALRWPSAWNLWSSARLAQVHDLEGVAAHLGRQMAAINDGFGPWDERSPLDKTDPRVIRALDPSVVELLNHRLPLAAWEQLLLSRAFPRELRPELLEALWPRAVLLGQDRIALAHTSELAKVRPKLAADLQAWSAEQNPFKRRQKAFFLVWDHRLWPQVLVVRGEAFEYGTLFARWQGPGPQPARIAYGSEEAPRALTGFAPKAQWTWLEGKVAKEGEREAKAIPAPLTWFCREALALADAAPEDPLVPEALSRAVRASRNANRDEASAALVRQAFRRLQGRYPNTLAAKAAQVYH